MLRSGDAVASCLYYHTGIGSELIWLTSFDDGFVLQLRITALGTFRRLEVVAPPSLPTRREDEGEEPETRAEGTSQVVMVVVRATRDGYVFRVAARHPSPS
jgi:hypothetical protein